MNISFRTGINTFLTLETVTFYPRRSIFRKSDVRRTFLRTCLTSFDAVFPISVKSEKRQDRKQRKNCSHRTKISAEETFLKAHSCKNQNQKDKSHQISVKLKVAGMEHGKYIPWLVPFALLYTPAKHKIEISASTIYFR